MAYIHPAPNTHTHMHTCTHTHTYTHTCTQVSVVADALNATGSMHDYPRVPECTLSGDLGVLQDRGLFSDVTLSVGGRVFQAHKALLAARSPVFSAMFEHSMEESLKVCALFRKQGKCIHPKQSVISKEKKLSCLGHDLSPRLPMF